MSYLYRKVKFPSGKVRYYETHQWDSGDPSNGIWYIEKKKSGLSYRWIAKKLADLPRAMKLAELEPHKDMICKKIIESSSRRMSISDLVDEIFAEIIDREKE